MYAHTHTERGLLNAALLYASMGWRVLPLHTPGPGGCSCSRPGCSSPGKHPRTRSVDEATNDLGTVEGLWHRWPTANIAIVTGDVVVLDVDGPEGLTALAQLDHDHGPLAMTPVARTGRGIHLYFNAPAERLANSAGALPPGLHVRGAGGYVVAPPSLHASGVRYRWKRGGPLAPLPSWLASLIKRPTPAPAHEPVPQIITASRYLRRAIEDELRRVASAPEGARNTTLNLAAFRLGQVAAALGELNDLSGPLLEAARAAGLADREARATIASGLQAGSRQPRRILPRAEGGHGPTHPGGWHA
jgi:hypothetical protein